MSQNTDQFFVERLNQHPKLQVLMESLLNVVENVTGDCTRADDTERYVIEELRKIGGIFKSVELVNHLIAKTKTSTGLKVVTNILTKTFKTGHMELYSHTY